MTYQWKALILAALWLNATLVPLIGVPVLLPSISAEFGSSISTTAWVSLAYSLAMAGAFMPASHAGDLLGHKKVALLGSYVEVLFMLIIVFAPNIGLLIGLRFGQGIVHSLAVPNFNAFAVGGFPQEQRGKAAGILNGAIGIGMLIVPFAVGFTSDQLGWRWVFFISSLIVLLITILGSFGFKEPSTYRTKPRLSHFDLPGASLLMVAVAPLIIGVQFIRNESANISTILIVVSVLLFLFFLFSQKRTLNPTLPIHMFKKASFAVPSINNIAIQFSQGVGVYILPVFFIQGLGWSATYAGAVLFGMAIGRPPSSVIGGFISDKFGGMFVIMLASFILVVSLAGLAYTGPSGTLSGLLPWMILYGASQSMVQTGLQKQMYGAVPKESLGMAPGVLGLGRHLGQAIGVGVAASIFSSFTTSPADNPTDGFRVTMFVTALIVGGTIAAASILSKVKFNRRK